MAITVVVGCVPNNVLLHQIVNIWYIRTQMLFLLRSILFFAPKTWNDDQESEEFEIVLKKQNKTNGSTHEFSWTTTHRKELLVRLFPPLYSDIFREWQWKSRPAFRTRSHQVSDAVVWWIKQRKTLNHIQILHTFTLRCTLLTVA